MHTSGNYVAEILVKKARSTLLTAHYITLLSFMIMFRCIVLRPAVEIVVLLFKDLLFSLSFARFNLQIIGHCPVRRRNYGSYKLIWTEIGGGLRLLVTSRGQNMDKGP